MKTNQDKLRDRVFEIICNSDGSGADKTSFINQILALFENSYKEREKKIFKKLENEIINAFMKVVGTVWGIEMGRGGWTDADSKLFNNTAVNIRNNLLEKLQALERTK